MHCHAHARAARDGVCLLPHGMQLNLIDGWHEARFGGNVFDMIWSEVGHADAANLEKNWTEIHAERGRRIIPTLTKPIRCNCTSACHDCRRS